MEELKFLALGDPGVGKTSFLITATTGVCPEEYVPTVFGALYREAGADRLIDNYSMNMMVGGKPVSLALWDTAGHEDYDRLRPLSYPMTNVFGLFFALGGDGAAESLEHVSSKWIPEAEEHCPGTPKILIGCKSDIADDDVLAQAKELAKKTNLVLVMSSSKTVSNLTSSLEKAAQIALGEGTPLKTGMKVVVVGDTGVGKSTLVQAFFKGVENSSSLEFMKEYKTVTLIDALEDIAGAEQYDRLRPLSYDGADAAVVCYSVANPSTLEHAKTTWVPEIRHAPIILVGLQNELRSDKDIVTALQAKGLHPVTVEEAAAVKDSLKLSDSIDCSAVKGKGVETVFEKAVKAVWDRDAKLAERKKGEKDKKKNKKKQRAEIVIQKDPEIERQILALGEQFERKAISFEEWNSRLQALMEAQALDLEQKEKARRMFEKYDTDGSGSIDAEEFRELTMKMSGEAWSDEELAKAIRDIDKDGSGTIDFDEFYAWWSSPDSHTVKNPKLASMRVDLQAKALKKRTAKIARGFTSAVKGSSEEASTKVDITLSAGDFEPKSSLNVTLLHDADLANTLRQRVNAADSDLVFSIAFTLAKDADVFEVGELSGLVKEFISVSKELLPYKNVRTECSNEADGTRVYRLSLSFDSNLHELIPETLKGLNIIKQLSIVLNLARGPGDKDATAGASLGLSADVGMTEDTLRQLVKGIEGGAGDSDDEDEDALGAISETGRGALFFACLRSFKLNLSLSDLDGTGLEGLLDWDDHRSAILELLVDVAGQPFVGGIVEKLSLLDGLHSIVLCGQEHVLQVQARSLNLFRLAPTPKELQTLKENAQKAADDPFAAYLAQALGADFLTTVAPGDDASGAGDDASDDEGEIEEPLVNRVELAYEKRFTASIAAADPLDVLHKATHWKEEMTTESAFGSVLELKSDQSIRVVAKIKDVPPGTYVPMARVKLHYFAKIESVEWSTNYEGPGGASIELHEWDSDAITQAKSNQWVELPIAANPITVGNPSTVTFQLAVPASDSWKTGLTLDWFGLKPAKPLPRVAQLKQLGACSRVAIFQEDAFNNDFSCVVCAACAEKCSNPANVNRKGTYSFFACKCNDMNPEGCKCHDVEVPAEKPSRLVRTLPVYQVDSTGLKAQFTSDVEVSAVLPANHPCPPSEVTYFEMNVIKAGEEKLTAIGLVDKSLRRSPLWPGWRGHSFGYHGDDGNLFAGRAGGVLEEHLESLVTFADGDTVGCGYDAVNQQVFFTHNGKLLAHCVSDVPARAYHPSVAMRGLGTSVEVNFTGPFKFAVDSWSPKGADDAECKPISCNKAS